VEVDHGLVRLVLLIMPDRLRATSQMFVKASASKWPRCPVAASSNVLLLMEHTNDCVCAVAFSSSM
jgi:hypothetical protein